MNEKRYNSGLVIRNPLLKIFNYILLILWVIIIIAPIVILFIISFKSNEEYTYTDIWTLPKSFYLGNFEEVIIDADMLLALKNTLILIIPSVIGSVLMGSMAAYALVRFNYKVNRVILILFILSVVVPQATTLIALFNVIKALGVFNTIYAGILIYLSAGVIDLYIYMQFIRKIPTDIDECALIDGASYFRLFYSIIMPQMKPAIVTVSILKILAIYNDYFVPLTFMTKPELYTLSVSLYRFCGDQFKRWNVLAAGILILLIPSIVIYLFAQKHIIAGATEGAVKA